MCASVCIGVGPGRCLCLQIFMANIISSPGSSHLSAIIVNLARYLVKFHPGPRRSVATQTGSD